MYTQTAFLLTVLILFSYPSAATIKKSCLLTHVFKLLVYPQKKVKIISARAIVKSSS